MRNRQAGSVSVYLAMLLVTVAVTVGVALVLFPEPQRTPTFVLSLVMLCVAEATLFAFPMYHAGSGGDRASPAFVFGLGFQATLGLYAAGVVALCLVAGGGELSFRTLAILHAVWATALLLVSGFWRLGSSHATQSAGTLEIQKSRFAEVRLRVDSFAASVARDRDPVMNPFIASVRALKDDVTYATPETLPAAAAFDGDLLAALERLGADYNSVRSQPDKSDAIKPSVLDLIDKARAMSAMVRERDAAIRAAR